MGALPWFSIRMCAAGSIGTVGDEDELGRSVFFDRLGERTVYFLRARSGTQAILVCPDLFPGGVAGWRTRPDSPDLAACPDGAGGFCGGPVRAARAGGTGPVLAVVAGAGLPALPVDGQPAHLVRRAAPRPGAGLSRGDSRRAPARPGGGNSQPFLDAAFPLLSLGESLCGVEPWLF